MKIPIGEIKVNPGRREAMPEDVKELAGSIAEVGLLNPITVDRDYNLIAGLHRLEAAKLLSWTEIECTVSSLEGLQAELAEIDENFVRSELSTIEFGNQLLRRKEIYEALHPETKNGGDRKSEKIRTRRARSDLDKSFVADTSEKLGISKRTVTENIQLAKNLTPEVKRIIQDTDTKVKKKDLLKISRLAPEQQKTAATRLSAGEIRSVDEFRPVQAELGPTDTELEHSAPTPPAVPYSLGSKRYATLEESIADLKNPNKDCSYTPDTLLADIDGFVQNFHRDFAWYSDPFCTVVFPKISRVQFEFVKQRFASIFSATEDLLHKMERVIEK